MTSNLSNRCKTSSNVLYANLVCARHSRRAVGIGSANNVSKETYWHRKLLSFILKVYFLSCSCGNFTSEIYSTGIYKQLYMYLLSCISIAICIRIYIYYIFPQRSFILCLYSGSKMCPKDNTTISTEQIFPDKFCERKIMELQIFCSNKHRGCNWTGPLKFFKVCVNFYIKIKGIYSWLQFFFTLMRLDAFAMHT
jgi:hypothetical protein